MHILLVNHKLVRLAEPWKATQIYHPYIYIYNDTCNIHLGTVPSFCNSKALDVFGKGIYTAPFLSKFFCAQCSNGI